MARTLPFHDGRTCIECAQPHRRQAWAWRCWGCDDAVTKARQQATRVLLAAIKAGQIPSARGLPCHFCGGEATDYEHRSYLRPLDVKPACRSCNLMRGPAIWRAPEPETAA